MASNNIVTLGNGTVSGDIYGGYALAEACVSKSVSGGCSDNVSSTDTVNVTTGTATASNNTVILDGSNGSGNLSQANLYGGVALTRQGRLNRPASQKATRWLFRVLMARSTACRISRNISLRLTPARKLRTPC